jgi:hypothetical protein
MVCGVVECGDVELWSCGVWCCGVVECGVVELWSYGVVECAVVELWSCGVGLYRPCVQHVYSYTSVPQNHHLASEFTEGIVPSQDHLFIADLPHFSDSVREGMLSYGPS